MFYYYYYYHSVIVFIIIIMGTLIEKLITIKALAQLIKVKQ